MAKSPLAAVRTLMARDRFAASCGVELLALRPGFARTRLKIAPRHLNGVGVVQGGAIFTLADLAFAAACNSNGTVAVALDVTITFARPGLEGALVAEARQVSVSRSVSVCEVAVTSSDGKLVALFRGTAFRREEPVEALLARQPAPAIASTRGRSAARTGGRAGRRTPTRPLRRSR